MTRRSEIATAVIGSGFIGTVHIEALRRIGVRVAGLLDASPELGARRAAELGLPQGLRGPGRAARGPSVQVVHVTSPNELHHPQVKRILAAGRHVVCEKPLAMTSAESAELVALAAASGLVNAVNFNIRFYPLNQHVSALVAEGGLGDVRLVTGRYFQDWLLYDTDWNWRLEKDQGGALRAVGDIGSPLAGPHELPDRAPRGGRDGRPHDVHPGPPEAGRRGPHVLHGARRGDGRGGDPHRGHGLHPPALRGWRPGQRQHQPALARAQEQPRLPDRRLLLRRGLGFGAAGRSCGSVTATGPTSSCSGTRR